jgi:hypothetical protein
MSEAKLKEYKEFDENIGREIKKFLWHGTLVSEDGVVVDVPLDRDRFKHHDTDAGEITLRFQDMIGWIILEKLVPIIVYYRPFCIVEIGAGVSTRLLAKVAEEFGVKLYSCDKSPRKNIRYIKNHIFVQKMSEDFIKEFDDTPSVVLIDGDHSYDMAKMEFDFFFEKLVPGGVIFLHDTYPMHQDYVQGDLCGDVYKLRQRLELRTHEMDVFTWPYTAGYHGLTMVMKKEEDRPYWEL